MPESPEHESLKKCVLSIFGGKPEVIIDGRVDVKPFGFCVEIETTRKTNRLEHAIEKLSSSACGGGVLIVSPEGFDKTMDLVKRLIKPADGYSSRNGEGGTNGNVYILYILSLN